MEGFTLSNAPVLGLVAGSILAGLLAGLWAGFRIVTRDASLVAALDRRVAESLKQSTAALAASRDLEAAWSDYLDEAERKRARTRAAQQRAEQAAAKAEEKEAAPESDLDSLSPRERRRAIARRFHAA